MPPSSSDVIRSWTSLPSFAAIPLGHVQSLLPPTSAPTLKPPEIRDIDISVGSSDKVYIIFDQARRGKKLTKEFF